jgi:hypothetical protein
MSIGNYPVFSSVATITMHVFVCLYRHIYSVVMFCDEFNLTKTKLIIVFYIDD